MPALRVMVVLLLALAAPVLAQTSPTPDDDAAWHEYVRLFVRTGFGRPSGESYMLKLDLAINDLDGKPAGTGTLEETRDLAGRTHWHLVAPGVELQSDSPEAVVEAAFGRTSFLARQALQMVTRPLADRNHEPVFDWARAERTVDDITYQCQTLQEHVTGKAGETFCFDAQKRLVEVDGMSGLVVRRTNFRRFGEWQVPQDVEVRYDGRVALTAHVAALQASRDVVGAATKVVAGVARASTINTDAMMGLQLKKEAPKYPKADRKNHVEGPALVCALIGKDGKIVKAEAVAAPDESLAKSAVDAVKKWEYRPYLLHGAPVEVETVIAVNFALHGKNDAR